MNPVVQPLEPRKLLYAGDVDLDFTLGNTQESFTNDGGFRTAVVIQLQNGKLLAANKAQIGLTAYSEFDDGPYTYTEYVSKYDLVRLNADGSRDLTFGKYGTLNTTLHSISLMREMPDGSVLIYGSYDTDPNTIDIQPQSALIRLDPDGEQDMTFGDMHGRRLIDFTYYTSEYNRDLQITPLGQLIIVKYKQQQSYLARYQPDGKIDLSFGNKGKLLIKNDLGMSLTTYNQIESDSEGNLYICGYSQSSDSRLSGAAVAKISAAGKLDLDYGHHGIAVLPQSRFGGESMHLDDDGSVLVVGTSSREYYQSNGSLDFESYGQGVRFTPEGEVDLDFAGGLFTPPRYREQFAKEWKITQDTIGRYIVSDDAMAYRINADGSFDSQFGQVLIQNDFILPQNDQRLVVFKDTSFRALQADNLSPANQVNVKSGTLRITATAKADRIDFWQYTIIESEPGSTRLYATVNGVGRIVDVAKVQRVHIEAGSGNDELMVSGSYRDGMTVVGGRGNDFIHCRSGRATVYGGSGNDSIESELGGDWFDGGPGNDTLRGSGWLEQYEPARGKETFYGGSGNDKILCYGHSYARGDDGNDTIIGSFSSDTLYGDAGDDQIDGNPSRDFIYGGEGNDLLAGGSGNDRIFGQNGDDTLHGGIGLDELSGDLGNDSITDL